MIRLGHIIYSNCIPVHALLLDEPQRGIELVRDVPARLNDLLLRGGIDVAPCSSIEYARHVDLYRILPQHAIGSAGAVQSILLESTVPLQQLHQQTVAVPSASATSVVLLRILLERQHGVAPRYEWFDQAQVADPTSTGAAAALRIGDVALSRRPARQRYVFDLGAEWYRWTGLPFAFAVWHVRRDLDTAAVTQLAHLLDRSRDYFAAHVSELAARHAAGFGVTPARLLDYWQSLRFDLDRPMQQGLLAFYRLAAEIGEAPAVSALDIVKVDNA